MKYLAIDYGQKRVGLAVCDPTETICSPLAIFQNDRKIFDRICELVNSEAVEAVVVGLPLNMDGTRGPQAETAERFAEKLQERLAIPVHLWDERLSSFSAEDKFACVDIKKTRRRKSLDAVAAAEILQSFLDNKNKSNKTE